MYSLVSATPIVQSIPYVNNYPLVLNASLKIFFSISYSSLYHLYLPYDLFLNESVFITINYFLLLAMVNILTILRAGWKITTWIDKYKYNKYDELTITVSINEWILQLMVDTITG